MSPKSTDIQVLVIDDSKLTRKTIEKLFCKNLPDVSVISVDNMHDAGELIMQHRFEVIFLDLNVETAMDGELVLEVLEESSDDTPVMLISSDKTAIQRMLSRFPSLNLVAFGKSFNATNVQLSIYNMTKKLSIKSNVSRIMSL